MPEKVDNPSPRHERRNREQKSLPPDKLHHKIGRGALFMTLAVPMAIAGAGIATGLAIRNGLHRLQNRGGESPNHTENQ